jgi:hypothetical protein
MTLEDLQVLNGLAARLNRAKGLYIKTNEKDHYWQFVALQREAAEVWKLYVPEVAPPWDGPIEVA